MFTIWDKVKSQNIKNIDGVITWIIEKIRKQDEQRYWINNRYIWLESDLCYSDNEVDNPIISII